MDSTHVPDTDWTANEAMRRMARPARTDEVLPAELEDALREGLEERGGCLVLRSQHTPASIDDLEDRTGYEAFVNHLHIDVQDGAALAIAQTAGKRIASMVLARDETELVRIIVSAESSNSATVRFHRLREGESWLAEGLDGYEQPVGYCDVGRRS